MKLLYSYILTLFTFTAASAQYAIMDSTYVDSIKGRLETFRYHSLEDRLEDLLNLAITYKIDSPALSNAYINEAETLINKSDQPELYYRVFTVKGTIYSHRGEYLLGLRELQKAIEHYETRKVKNHHVGYLHITVGNTFYHLNQYRDAISFYDRAYQAFQELDNEKGREGAAVALNNIGLCLLEDDQLDTAVTCFTKALIIRDKLGDKYLVTHSYTHLMEAYLKYDKIAKADSVLDYAFSEADLDTQSVWYKNLKLQRVQLLLKKHKRREAGRRLNEINYLSFGKDYDFFEPSILQTKARYALAAEHFNEAQDLLDMGLKKAMKVHNYKAALEFNRIGLDLHMAQNNIERALQYSNQMLQIKDSIAATNAGVVSELLDVNEAFARAQVQNQALKNTSEDYRSKLNGRAWMLVVATLIIITLLILFWYINKLSRKQKRNELNQRELNQRILAVVNNTDSIILSINSDGLIRLINQSAIEFFRTWTHIEIAAGDNLFDKIHNPDVRKLWGRWFEKSQKINGWKEVTQITIKEKVYYYLQNFSTITRENGKYAGLVLVGNDITREHEYNVELSNQRDTLEKSNKAKEKMLSILAHDLKDAVYSARSLAEMVTETPDQFPKEELIHLFGLLYNNFDRTKKTLDGLLEWMKTQTGAMEAKPKTFNLEELSQEILDSCRDRASNKCITLAIEMEKDQEVFADREMIKTVMRNLVSNAIKYTDPDKGKVTIRSIVNNDKAEIHITDNGRGISLENQQKLFRFGGRYTTPGTQNEQGTGFGLSLCKELLRLNNTSLMLESQEKKGSDFYFSLPLVDKKKRVLGEAK